MLEKNSNILYFDAHFHYSDAISCNAFQKNDFISGCTCALNQQEWIIQEKSDEKFLKSYGIHPQKVQTADFTEEMFFLENLITQKKLKIIGEIGMDLYSDSDKSNEELQKLFFISQLELAIKYNLSVVIHCRKANDKLFEFSNLLKKLPSVLFHSFMGNSIEAKNLLKKDINGFFSFGKQMMNNNKKVLDCAISLPENTLLLETDAPFQFLKNETVTKTNDVIKIYEYAQKLKNINDKYSFANMIEENYKRMFCI